MVIHLLLEQIMKNGRRQRDEQKLNARRLKQELEPT